MLFNNTHYTRKDHYHAKEPLRLEFRDSRLQLVKIADSVYLAGTLQVYAPEHLEPEKPIYISLVRT